MNDTFVYVALGDSTAVGLGALSGGGYPERLLRRLAVSGGRLVNLGRSGATSADVLDDQVPLALRAKPSLITLGIGINDLGLQVPDDAFALTLEEVAVRLARAGAPIVLANLPDLALSPAVARRVPRQAYEQRIELFNQHIEATAARHRLALLDLYALSRDALDPAALFSADGFHPSEAGYELWAEHLEPIARGLLGGEDARAVTG